MSKKKLVSFKNVALLAAAMTAVAIAFTKKDTIAGALSDLKQAA